MNNVNNKLAAFAAIPIDGLKKISAAQPSPGEIGETTSLTSPDEIMTTGEHTETILNDAFTDSAPGANSGDFTTPLPGAAINPPGTKLGAVMGGKMVTDIFDVLFPALAVWGISSLGYAGLTKQKLQLTAKEKEVVNPAVQAYLDSININFNNPLYNLLFVLCAVYGAKAIEIIPELKKVAPGKKVVKGEEVKQSHEMTKEEHIQSIMKKRRKGRQDAEEFYFKNVA
jgi:hypothetical protein